MNPVSPDELRKRFVDVHLSTTPQYWQVGGSGRRFGEIGLAIANIALRHSAGFEVVLQFPDGKLESFSPHSLFPAPTEEPVHPQQKENHE